MNFWLLLLNDIAVSAFGIVLSASFSGVFETRRSRRIFWCGILINLLLQAWVFYLWGAVALENLYPLVVHLPLFLLLWALTRKPLWSAVSVLTAYLCCQLRRWIALFAVWLVSGDSALQDVVEIAITVPLLLLLLRFVAPSIRELSKQPTRFQLQFGIIPALYFAFDYVTVVYTDLLMSGEPVVVEFMPFVCCVVYLEFLLYNSAERQKRDRLQQVQKSLDIQLSQSVREISALRESQALAGQYRHDLRHHLQYVFSCIENGQEDKAKDYISGICHEIEAQKVLRYCENETVNLILSAFAKRAKSDGIDLNIKGALSESNPISDSDLCVLLSNALENAINACRPFVSAGTACTIDVQFFERKGKFFLQVTNPCGGEVRFENGIPVSDRPEHGVGVQSICAIVKRYGGIYSFSVEDGRFVLRLSF